MTKHPSSSKAFYAAVLTALLAIGRAPSPVSAAVTVNTAVPRMSAPMPRGTFNILQGTLSSSLGSQILTAAPGLRSALTFDAGSSLQMQALGPLAAQLPADFTERVMASRTAADAEAVVKLISDAYLAAAPAAVAELDARTAAGMAQVGEGAQGVEALESIASQMSAYGVYGPATQGKVSALRGAARAARTQGRAQALARRLLEGLTATSSAEAGNVIAVSPSGGARVLPKDWMLQPASARDAGAAAAGRSAAPVPEVGGAAAAVAQSPREEFMAALEALPPGEERAKLLYKDGNRDLVLNSGANVTLYEGALRQGDTWKERLSGVNVALVARQNKSGQRDGRGALGGLSNRTTLSPAKFNALSEDAKRAILEEKGNEKDDIVLVRGRLQLINDIDVIRQRTIEREMREELADLGLDSSRVALSNRGPLVTRSAALALAAAVLLGLAAVAAASFVPGATTPLAVLSAAMLLVALGASARSVLTTSFGPRLVALEGVRDDNFILNIWGKVAVPAEKVFAVTPFNHLFKIDSPLFDAMMNAQKAKSGGEAAGLGRVPLMEALRGYGKPAAKGEPALEDGRDARTDYRYPHEWVSSWALASRLVGGSPEALTQLAYEAQSEAGSLYKLDFNKVAEKMGVPLAAIDDALGAPRGTVAAMQAAIDRAAATRVPTNAEELVRLFARSESINANINADIIKALAARGKMDEAELKRRLENFIAMYPAFESQRDANNALREAFDKENPAYAGPLARVQHEAWLKNEKLGKKFVLYTVPLHRLLQQAVADGVLLNPEVPVTENQKLTVDQFENFKKKYRFRAEHFVFENDADGAKKAAFEKAFAEAAGRPFLSGFEISTVAGEWDVLHPAPGNADAITVSAANREAWNGKRAGFLAGLQQDNVAGGLAALHNTEVLAKLASAKSSAEHLDALVDMIRIINVGWRLNNPWFGFDYKLQYRPFNPDPALGIGMDEIIKDAITFKATVETVLANLDDMKMPAKVKDTLRALRGDPAFLAALNDSVDAKRLEAAIFAQADRPVTLQNDLSNLLPYLSYMFSKQSLIEQFMNGDILKVLEGRWDKVARAEVVRRIENAPRLLEVLEYAQDANDALHTQIAPKLPARAELSLARAAHAAWLEQESASTRGQKLVRYTANLRDLLARYAGEGALSSDGPVTAQDIESARANFRFNARSFKDAAALRRFSEDFKRVTGENFVDESGNPWR